MHVFFIQIDRHVPTCLCIMVYMGIYERPLWYTYGVWVPGSKKKGSWLGFLEVHWSVLEEPHLWISQHETLGPRPGDVQVKGRGRGRGKAQQQL